MKSLRCTRDVMDRWEIQKCKIVCGENGEESSARVRRKETSGCATTNRLKTTLDLSTIREIVKTRFDVLTDEDTSTLNIQGFDDNFGEWVDLRATFITEHKQRLRICLKKPARVSYLC